jgi:hypothetical protein
VLTAGAANRNGQIASPVRNITGKPLLNKVNDVFFHALDNRKFPQKGFHWFVMSG